MPEAFRNLQQFLMQKQKSGFTPLFLIFLICTQQMAWQGYGQVNRTVVDTIMGYINTNVSQHTGDSSYDTFNTAFSTELNRRWDPAWNVFTIKTDSTYDSVCYGYAFNNQWMWYNDYRVNGVVLAFVIWKDYNCQDWQTVGENGQLSGMTDPQKGDMISYTQYNRAQVDDIWNGLKSLTEQFRANSNPYSFVASQDTNSKFYGRICVLGNEYFYSKKDNQFLPFVTGTRVGWGNLFVFRTRSFYPNE